jgi:hypothetical protein
VTVPADEQSEVDRARGTGSLVALDGGQGTINVPSWAPDGSAFAYVDYPVDQHNDPDTQ